MLVVAVFDPPPRLDDEEVAAIVIGLPIHLNGSEGEQAKAARAFGAWLHEATGLPCVFYDERFTTFEAESVSEWKPSDTIETAPV